MSVALIVEQGLAEIYEKFSGRSHPYLMGIESELQHWFSETEWAGWSNAARIVASHRLGELAALAYPDAEDPLPLAKMLAWMTVVDDIVESCASENDSVTQTLLELLLSEQPPEMWHCEGAAKALADLWPAITQGMTLRWQRRLRIHVADCFRVEKHWQASRRSNVPPSLESYVIGRREDGVFIVGLDLVERVLCSSLPHALFQSESVQQLWTASIDVIVWTNDLLSADREIAAGDAINLIRVLENEGCSRLASIAKAMSMLQQRTQEFFAIASQLRVELQGGSAQAEMVERWVSALQCTMRGLYDWSASTKRYRNASVISLPKDPDSTFVEISAGPSPLFIPVIPSNVPQIAAFLGGANKIEFNSGLPAN